MAIYREGGRSRSTSTPDTSDVSGEDYNFAGINLPEPTAADLKWKEKFDNLVKKKNGRVSSPKLAKELIFYLKEDDNLWRANYILFCRSKSDNQDRFLNFKTRFEPWTYHKESLEGFFMHFSRQGEISDDAFKLMVYSGCGFDTSREEILEMAAALDYSVIKRWMEFDRNVRKHDALVLCAQKDSLDEFKGLIAIGADVKHLGSQALIYAVENQNLEFVKYIIDFGADPFAQDGKSMELAKRLGKDDIHAYLMGFLNKGTSKKIGKDKAATQLTKASNDQHWSILSPTTIQKYTPAIAEGPLRGLLYVIDFDSGMVTTAMEHDKGLTASQPQPFSEFGDVPLLSDAYKIMLKNGHDVKRVKGDMPVLDKPNITSIESLRLRKAAPKQSKLS